jgi:hypothetical protein
MARMPRDGLAALARLRRLETAEAKRRLAVTLGQEADAAARLAAAGAALRAEHAAGEEAWRRWLPRGLAERDRAVIGQDHAAARRDAALPSNVMLVASSALPSGLKAGEAAAGASLQPWFDAVIEC